MKRAFIASAAVGTLLLLGAGAANADSGVRFDVHIGVPLYGVRHLPPPPPRIFVIPRERHVRYWGPPRPYHYRHYDRWHHRHGGWRERGWRDHGREDRW